MGGESSTIFEAKRILLLACHPDDLELGCGGTLWKLRKEILQINIMTDALNYPGNETILSDLKNSMTFYGIENYHVEDFTNMALDLEGTSLRQLLYNIKESFKPDVVFSTSPKAFNQDHRELGLAVLAVFQEQTVLFYEDLRGSQLHIPQVYVKLSSDEFMAKLKALTFYESQKTKYYFMPDAISSLAQFRGSQIFMPYAESFELGRVII